MINASSYTPLESLLLFTWIRTHGVDALEAAAFPRLSDDLINNDSIKQDPTYDAARLNPESLKELFLHLLQEELKDDTIDVKPADGSLSPNSRKRKRPRPAPTLTTLVEARQHAHKLQAAEAKLWDKYKKNAAHQLWEEQEELRKLDEEIARLELQEKQLTENRKSVSAVPIAAPSPAPESIRTPNTAHTGDIKKPRQTNGTSAPSASPSIAYSGAPKAVGPQPPRQISPIRPAAIPQLPRPSAQPPAVLPAQASPSIGKPQESPRLQKAPVPILQPPQGVPAFSPPPGQPSPSAPSAIDVPQRPPSAVKPEPSRTPKSPQVSVSGPLKWEPPYQPQPGSQQPRPPVNVPQYAPLKGPAHPQHQWPSQPHLQYPQAPPIQPPPQGHVQQGIPPMRPILAAPQPGGHGAPALHPAPIRSHSASPVPPQQPRLSQGPPSLPGQGRMPPQPPYQHTQQVFPQPQSLPAHTRIAPNVSSTPPPLSPANGPPPPQWSKPPPPMQAPPPGTQQFQQPGFPVPPVSSAVPPFAAPYPQATRPAVPPRVLPQSASTPGPGMRRPHPVLPHTPLMAPLAFVNHQGSGTKWRSTHPTPSTPGPTVGEVQSPAFEQLSPILQSAGVPTISHKKQSKPADINTSAAKKVPRVSAQREPSTGDASHRSTPSASMRDQFDQMDLDSATKVKREDATPRPLEDTGDTTADESVSGRRQIASPRASRAVGKRKRLDSSTSDLRATSEVGSRIPPPAPPGIPTHVLWTRGFPRVSVSTLDQISSNKHANMFSKPISERDAPGYRSIVLSPTDIKTIRAAINAGNKAAIAAASALNVDPGTTSVWLPISEDLVPPRGIINSSQLERELVHMFANAIMYNLDPYRGPGPAFMRGSGMGGKGANEAHGHAQGHGGGDGSNMIWYQVDENSVVKDTQAMFAEVDKLLIELRSTEVKPDVPTAPLPPGAVPASERLARGSFTATSATDTRHTPGSFVEEDGDDHHTDREAEGASVPPKRRRFGRG